MGNSRTRFGAADALNCTMARRRFAARGTCEPQISYFLNAPLINPAWRIDE
jgi:hypothetical protein